MGWWFGLVGWEVGGSGRGREERKGVDRFWFWRRALGDGGWRVWAIQDGQGLKLVEWVRAGGGLERLEFGGEGEATQGQGPEQGGAHSSCSFRFSLATRFGWSWGWLEAERLERFVGDTDEARQTKSEGWVGGDGSRKATRGQDRNGKDGGVGNAVEEKEGEVERCGITKSGRRLCEVERRVCWEGCLCCEFVRREEGLFGTLVGSWWTGRWEKGRDRRRELGEVV